MESPLIVRRAGLPARVLDLLRFDTSFALVDEVVQRRRRVEVEGGLLADALYEVIGGLPEGGPKPGVVGLRRALHRGRAPRAAEWNEQVASALPPPVADRVRGWVGEVRRTNRTAGALPDVLSDEESAKRADLRAVVHHAGLRRGLSQSSPALSAELGKWLADEEHPPRRQSLVALARYVARASAKTSPYGTFMVSGTGRWTEEGPLVRAMGPNRVRGVLELDGLLLQGLVRSLCADPTLASSLRLRANPSATTRDGVVSFAGRRPDEPILTVPATPAIRACLRILASERELARPDLRDALVALGGASADSVEAFLDRLVDLGLVERLAPVADLSGDPLGELGDWLRARGDERAAGIASLVGRVRREARRAVPVDDVDGHEVRQRALVRAVRDLAARVDGLPAVDEDAPKWTVHENAVLTEPAVECSLARWRPALRDLDVVRRWLAPFDPSLPLRLALAAYFRERFGTGATVPVLAVHRALQEALWDDGAPTQTPAARDIVRLLHARADLVRPLTTSRSPRLRELSRIQQEARDVALNGPTVNGVVRPAPAALADLAATWPPWVTPTGSLGCYLQTTGDTHAPSLVLNAVQNGYGRGRSRVLHLIEQAGGAPPTDGAGRFPVGGPETAELGGHFASSVNVRAAAAPYELDYPFTTSHRPSERRIRTGDCVAVHDPRLDLVRLRAESLDTEIVPLHLGMMGDLFLPAVAQVLTQAFGHGYYMYPSVALVADDELDVPDSVTAYPRVTVGGVVLRRACWVAPVERVPSRANGDTDADYWLRLVRWLRAHDIPTECFVRLWADGLRPGTDPRAERTWALDTSHKPCYVDFSNWYLVLAFRRMLNGPAAMAVFEEALPAPRQARTPSDEPAVTEFLVEISG